MNDCIYTKDELKRDFLDWVKINTNVVNISKVLNNLVNTTEEMNVEWIVYDQDGNIVQVNVPNLATIIAEIRKNAISEDQFDERSNTILTSLVALQTQISDIIEKIKNNDMSLEQLEEQFNNLLSSVTILQIKTNNNIKDIQKLATLETTNADNIEEIKKTTTTINQFDERSNTILTSLVALQTQVTSIKDFITESLNGVDMDAFERKDITQTRTGDVIFTKDTDGVVLTDRKTGLQYRLYIDNGNLGIEEL